MYIAIAILAVVIVCVGLFVKKIQNDGQGLIQNQNIKYGFIHPNGNLDFYISKDGEFVSRTANQSFRLEEIERVMATVGQKIVFSKTKDETTYHAMEVERLFEKHVAYVKYEFIFKNGDTFDSIVDVASNKLAKQRNELKQSLNKLTTLLNQLELQ